MQAEKVRTRTIHTLGPYGQVASRIGPCGLHWRIDMHESYPIEYDGIYLSSY